MFVRITLPLFLLLLPACKQQAPRAKQSSESSSLKREPKSLQGQQINEAVKLSNQADQANEELKKQADDLFDE